MCRAPSDRRSRHLCELGAVALTAVVAALVVCFLSGSAVAQGPADIGDVPAELLQTRVARPRGEVLRRLERLQWLVEHESWDEVGDVAGELLTDSTDGWVAVEPERDIGVRPETHRRLAALPPAGLAAYRRRVDPLADDWLRRGIDERDERRLRQVVDQAFCSSAADDALWALGEISLERGDYQAARAAWQAIHRETAGDGATAYPDTALSLADVRARLALVSLREGDLDRAEREIAAIASQHPEATGRLGGRDVKYAARLTELLAQAREWPAASNSPGNWPALFGNSQRTNVSSLATSAAAKYEQAWSLHLTPLAEATEISRQPAVYPVVADGTIIFQDAAGIHAAPLEHDQDAPAARRLHAALSSAPPVGTLTVTLQDRKAYAIVAGKSEPRAKAPSTHLLGLDLARDGALLFQLTPEEEASIFLGPPVVTSSRVVVCELAIDQGMKASVVCYEWTGKVAWRRSLGWAFSASNLNSNLAGSMAMAGDGGVVYVNTNLGMVAAIRVDDGEPLWQRTYDRSLPGGAAAAMVSTARRPNPCFVSRSRVIVSPDDSGDVMALDAATGAEQWSTPLPAIGARVLAVDPEHIVLSGERLWAINIADGKIDDTWGDEPGGGVGQGVVSGDLVFWATIGDVLLVDRSTGKLTGQTLPLPAAGGANLVVCTLGGEEFILAAGPDRLTAYRRTSAAAAADTDAD
jgi:cellulose synthase operon protein C